MHEKHVTISVNSIHMTGLCHMCKRLFICELISRSHNTFREFLALFGKGKVMKDEKKHHIWHNFVLSFMYTLHHDYLCITSQVPVQQIKVVYGMV